MVNAENGLLKKRISDKMNKRKGTWYNFLPYASKDHNIGFRKNTYYVNIKKAKELSSLSRDITLLCCNVYFNLRPR